MTKKHLLFALIVCMSTVWRLLELLEYGEIEVRQVDTYRRALPRACSPQA